MWDNQSWRLQATAEAGSLAGLPSSSDAQPCHRQAVLRTVAAPSVQRLFMAAAQAIPEVVQWSHLPAEVLNLQEFSDAELENPVYVNILTGLTRMFMLSRRSTAAS